MKETANHLGLRSFALYKLQSKAIQLLNGWMMALRGWMVAGALLHQVELQTETERSSGKPKWHLHQSPTSGQQPKQNY